MPLVDFLTDTADLEQLDEPADPDAGLAEDWVTIAAGVPCRIMLDKTKVYIDEVGDRRRVRVEGTVIFGDPRNLGLRHRIVVGARTFYCTATLPLSDGRSNVIVTEYPNP